MSVLPFLRGFMYCECSLDDVATDSDHAAIALDAEFVRAGGVLRYLHIVDELSAALTSQLMWTSARRSDFPKRMRQARRAFGYDVIHPSVRMSGELWSNEADDRPFWLHFDTMDGEEAFLSRVATPLFMAIAGVHTGEGGMPAYALRAWKDWWWNQIESTNGVRIYANALDPADWPALVKAVRPMQANRSGKKTTPVALATATLGALTALCNTMIIGAALARGPAAEVSEGTHGIPLHPISVITDVGSHACCLCRGRWKIPSCRHFA